MQRKRDAISFARFGISGILDFRRFDRQVRRRLYRGFVFAALVLVLVAALWHPRSWRIRAVSEESGRTITTDIVEIPAKPGVNIVLYALVQQRTRSEYTAIRR